MYNVMLEASIFEPHNVRIFYLLCLLLLLYFIISHWPVLCCCCTDLCCLSFIYLPGFYKEELFIVRLTRNEKWLISSGHYFCATAHVPIYSASGGVVDCPLLDNRSWKASFSDRFLERISKCTWQLSIYRTWVACPSIYSILGNTHNFLIVS